ncbi:hypothetical protein RFI_27808 [Reticulomyxa filosa]|uniref:Uncharacterized protein n=1 Tax=Reticulomyxa filosa TaxID=46433 RepID=X6M6M9_RETFI|nr:hypothetical protein RFI_27808 [Reticulomyxa filosa]|eukprot:ETO09569.1 hypothetical protein RFI_27808 [Reticulomyxa filosa]
MSIRKSLNLSLRDTEAVNVFISPDKTSITVDYFGGDNFLELMSQYNALGSVSFLFVCLFVFFAMIWQVQRYNKYKRFSIIEFARIMLNKRRIHKYKRKGDDDNFVEKVKVDGKVYKLIVLKEDEFEKAAAELAPDLNATTLNALTHQESSPNEGEPENDEPAKNEPKERDEQILETIEEEIRITMQTNKQQKRAPSIHVNVVELEEIEKDDESSSSAGLQKTRSGGELVRTEKKFQQTLELKKQLTHKMLDYNFLKLDTFKLRDKLTF